MCDVTSRNFHELWPSIQSSIDEASFVSFDCEFSALTGHAGEVYSVFDSIQRRYSRQCASIRHSLIVQFGLCTFTCAGPHSYEARVFNFHLCPRPLGPIDRRFIMQASSVRFLRKYNFDFNKFLCDGIPFLNAQEQAVIEEHIKQGRIDQLSCNDDERFIQGVCSRVAEWLSGVTTSDDVTATSSLSDDCWSMRIDDVITRYLVHKHLRARFPQIWTASIENEVLVTRVDAATRCHVARTDTLDEQCVHVLVGFSHVVRHVSQRRVPLVGHNCLTDLLLLHNLFISPLPDSYAEFKCTIHRWFPLVFDTKHIVYSLRSNSLHSDVSFVPNCRDLSELFTLVTSQRGRPVVLHAPTISLHPTSDKYANSCCPHEAGYDAYMTGICLLQLAHIIAHLSVISRSEKHRPLRWNEYSAVLARFNNRINVIRSSVNHMNLSGDDPVALRPGWLYFTCIQPTQRCNAKQLSDMLCEYGTADVRLYDNQHAIVLMSSHAGVNDVLRAFRRNKLYRVERYSYFRHSSLVKCCLWSAVLMSGGVSLMLFLMLSRPQLVK